MNSIEKIFLDIISNFDKNDLEYAIRKNLDLAQLALEYFPPYQIKLFRILASFFKKNKDFLTTRSFLLFLSEKRPDLAQVIVKNDSIGIKWLDSNIKNFKKLLW